MPATAAPDLFDRASRAYLQALTGLSGLRLDSFLAEPDPEPIRLDALKRCTVGISCGSTCITKGKECRVKARPAATAKLKQLVAAASGAGAKKNPTSFASPQHYERALKKHITADPRFKKARQAWAAEKQNADGLLSYEKKVAAQARKTADPVQKKKWLVLAEKTGRDADRSERLTIKYEKEMRTSARIAERGFKKANGLQTSAEDRALTKEMKLRG